MKNIFILSIIMLTAFCACKKDKKHKDPEPVTAPAPTPNTNYTGWCRVYNEYHYMLWTYTEVPMISFARAFFSTNEVNDSTAASGYTYTNAGMVTVNTIDTLPYFISAYEKTPSALTYSAPTTWSVAGSSTVSAFSATCNLPFPTCTGYNTFATTISKNAGVTYTITNFTDTDRILVNLSDGNGQYIYSHWATIDGNTATVKFPGNETVHFLLSSTGYVDVYLFNDELQVINGKNIKFSHIKKNYINGFTIVN